jgi:hypothetical protein
MDQAKLVARLERFWTVDDASRELQPPWPVDDS